MLLIRGATATVLVNAAIYAAVHSRRLDGTVYFVGACSLVTAIVAEPILRVAARRIASRGVPVDDPVRRVDLLLRALSTRYLAGIAIALECFSAAFAVALWWSHQTFDDFSATPMYLAVGFYACGALAAGWFDPRSIGRRFPPRRLTHYDDRAAA
jgi:hypothetical protein